MIESALHYVLANDVANAAVVGVKVYPLLAPQDAVLPYETYQRIFSSHEQDMGGPDPLANARFQVDCFALTYAQAKAAATAVRLVLDGLRGLVGPAAGQVEVRRGAVVSQFDQHTPPVDAQGVGVFGVTLEADIYYIEATT